MLQCKKSIPCHRGEARHPLVAVGFAQPLSGKNDARMEMKPIFCLTSCPVRPRGIAGPSLQRVRLYRYS
jgi:hypothetical protein